MSFKSWLSYSKFSKRLCNEFRYILDNESNEFLNSINDTCNHRIKTLKAGSVVWRAQIGCDKRKESDIITNEQVPFSFKRMMPLIDEASEGRVNTKGIPCLYVTSDRDTAIHEVRPWPGSVVTIAKLHLKRDVRLIDFSKTAYAKQYPYFSFGELPIEKRIEAVWAAMDIAFSWPVTASDSNSEYAPTQIISEFIKSKGYDGIIYKSSLTQGQNYALFNLNDADVVQCDLFEVSKVKLDFQRLDDVSPLTELIRDVYEYLGLVLFFDRNEREPIYIHAKFQDKESKAELQMLNGCIHKIVIKDKGAGLEPKKRKEFEEFVNAYADDIVNKWVDYFVKGKCINTQRITEKVKISDTKIL